MLAFQERYYKLEKVSKLKPSNNDPLQKNIISNIKTKTTGKSVVKSVVSSNFVDPLDPLSAVTNSSYNNEDIIENSSTETLNIEPWSSKRLTILATYTTSEKLSIVSSFLIAKPNEEIKIVSKSSNTLTDKVKNRIEQLDIFDEEVRETSNLSVQQFTEKINELNYALNSSWEEGQRVKSLQIVIQTTKLLSEASVAQFFPSKFVLVTDLVDNFARLVFDRLKSKSAYTQRGSKVLIQLPKNFNESQVPEVAKETAKNWFYKVASIRELVARLYVEAALLPCYKFFDSASINPALNRLVKMSRGIGDPLLATYARAYIARIGITLNPNYKEYLQLSFEDVLSSLQLMRGKNLSAVSTDTQMPYLRLFVPAVDWLMQCLTANCSKVQLDEIMHKIETVNNPLLVHASLCSLDTNYINEKPLYFANLIQNLPDSAYPCYTLYRQLGVCVSMLSKHKSPLEIDYERNEKDGQSMKLLKSVWGFISKLSETRHFLECADAWTEFIALNFNYGQITRFLVQIVKEIQRDSDYRLYYNQLQSILNKIVNCNCDFANLLSSSEFIQFLSLFDKEPIIIEARQLVLESFFACTIGQTLSDHVIIQACVRILREMHDSLNSLSVVDSRRAVTRLTLQLLDRVRSEGRQVESELELLTQFRANLGVSSEQIMWAVTERANTLAMRVRSLRPNQIHNSGSGAFVRACLAFSYITIASITQQDLAIRLYTSTAQVAIVNGCLGQAEACLKEAIQLISKLDTSVLVSNSLNTSSKQDKSTSTSIIIHTIPEMAANVASTLLMCMDINTVASSDRHGDGEVASEQQLYLLKGLINAINMCPALKIDPNVVTSKSVVKGELYIKILMLLSAYTQPEYIYHGGHTDANDRIYGGSDQLIQTISELFTAIVIKTRSLNSPKINQLLKEALYKILNYVDDNLEKPQWLNEILEIDQSVISV